MFEIYEVNGKKFKVSPNKKEDFLSKYPEAVLTTGTKSVRGQVRERDEDRIQEGKQMSSAIDAATEQETSASDSQSGTTSSDSQKENKGWRSSLSNLGLGFLEFAQGVSSFSEALQLGVTELFTPGTMTPEQKLAELTKIRVRSQLSGGLPASVNFEEITTKLEDNLPEYETQSITEDIEKGNYSQAAKRTVDGFLRSAPSLVAAASGVGGLIALGTSVAGNKFEEELLENPEESTGKLLLNAQAVGATEAAFELVTRGLLKKAGLINIKQGAEAAAKMLSSGAKEVVKNFGLGMGAEGASEAATTLTTKLIDKLTLNKDIKSKPLLYELGDSFILGSFTSGAISTVGAVSGKSKVAKDRAEVLLTPDGITSKVNESVEVINKLVDDLPQSSQAGKEFINEKIEQERLKIVSLRKEASELLSNLEGEELSAYAKNVDEIIKLKEVAKEAKTDSEKAIVQEKYQALNDANIDLLKTAAKKSLDKNIANIEKISKQVYGDQVEIKRLNADQVKTFIEDNPDLDEETKRSISEDAALSQGFFEGSNKDGKQFIVINEDVASSTFATNVAGHEFLHKALDSTFKNNPKVQSKVGRALLDTLMEMDLDQVVNSKFASRLKQYEGKVEGVKAEEVLTILSDSLSTGDLQFNETIFTKIGDIIRRALQDLGIKNVKFNTGRDVYNFVKDYNKSIEKGKLKGAIRKAAVEGVEGRLVEEAEVMEQKQPKMSKDVQPEVDDLGAPMGWDNESWKSGGAAFALSEMQQNKMLDGLIAAKLKVPMSYSDTQEFIQKVYAELTGHVNNFKPESNDSLFGWINSQLANKAGNVYNREYKATEESRAVDIDATTTEGAPVVQIEAEPDVEMQRIDEIGLDEKQIEERSKLRRELELNEDMINTVKNAVVKTFGTKLPEVTSKDFRAALEKAFRTELKKPIQDLMGGRVNYDAFLDKYSKAFFDALPVETLVQMERNLKPEQRIFTSSRRITKPVEVDKLISEGKLPKDTNRLSGPQLHTKKPYPGINKMMAFYRGKDMESILGYKVGASTLGTRKDKLAMELGVELAFDATSDVLQQPDVIEKRKGILELQGLEQLENELAVVAKQINRNPNIKFSRTKLAVGISKDNAEVFISGLDQVLDAIKGNKVLVRDWKSIRNVMKDIYPSIDVKQLNAAAKNIAKYADAYSKLEIKRGKIKVDVDLTQFIKENVEADVLDKGILQLLSDKIPSVKTIGDLFKSPERVARARQAFSSFIKHTKEDLGWSDAKIKRYVATMYKGMYASASKIGDGSIAVNEDGSVVALEGENFGTNRGQVFMNVDDFYSLLGYTKEDFKSVNTKTFSEKSADAVKDQDYKGRLKQAEEARESVKALMDYYISNINEGNLDYGDLAMLTRMFGSNMNSPMKRAANLAYIAKGVESIPSKQMGKLTEYEHIIPTNVKILEMVKSYINDGKISDDFFSDYEIAIIPKTMDKVLIANGLRDFLPVTYKKGDPNTKRYFNRQTLGEKNLVPLVSIKTGEKGKVIGEDFVEASNLLVSNTVDIKGQQLIGRTMIKYSKSKGMSTFDFDETLIIDGKNFIIAKKDGETVKISSGDWPIKGPKFAEQGYEFDFSDFVNVRGGVDGPLLQKMRNQIEKYGPKNVFVLTARMQEAAKPIHEWLKSKGINIPIENITGLGKSQGEAKAEWMLEKYAEGYNDMYFVDDALPNVRAVKQVLDALDIKSKVVQARIKFSKTASQDFNKMLERTKGVGAEKVFSAAEATLRGAKKGRFRFFIPPSAEDFKGLIYNFLGTGKQGEADLKWFEENLFIPFSKGIRELNSVKQAMTEEYTALKKAYPEVVRSLNDKVGDTSFTVDHAIRVYLWNKYGFEIPGISKSALRTLLDHVNNNQDIARFADILSAISRRPDGYIKPKEYWVTQSIASDLVDVVTKVNRVEYLAEWIENKDLVFSPENLNKIESIYGSSFRDALENILFRMQTGSNRPVGKDKTVNNFLNWINGSVGAVMFFNTRSAILQTLSTVNFLNFEDNNIFKAAKAFANQKQFWQDFTMIFNSDMLKQRRAGLKIDVSASELTDAFAQGKNKVEAAIAYLLQIGFTPTQVADSFAISMGGSTFYRNRVNKYLKEGKSQKDAEDQAFLDFQEIAEETQQSSRPDLISQQQASVLGRLILAWGNTPMQMTRLTKKALSDIVNGRGDLKANISRVIYYGVAQNIIFGTLQTALLFTLFGEDNDEEEKKKKEVRVANGVFDTLLRGTGVYGAAISTIKNIILKWNEESQKPYGRKDLSKVTQEIINLSPPMGTKVRKIMSAIKTYDYNKDVIKKMDHGINNPKWNIFANIIEAVTNAPTARLLNKANNLREATNTNHDIWQRAALALGWSKWDVGVKDAELEEAREEVREERKQKSKEKAKKKREEKKKQKEAEQKAKGIEKVRCKARKSDGTRCKNQTTNKNKRCYAHQ